jgi:hypothetical protein
MDIPHQIQFHMFCLAFIFSSAGTSIPTDVLSPLTAKWQNIQNQWKKLGKSESLHEPLELAAELELEKKSVSFFEHWDQVFKYAPSQNPSPEEEWLAIQEGWAQLVHAIEQNGTKAEDTSRIERQLRRRMSQCWNARTIDGVLGSSASGQGGINMHQAIRTSLLNAARRAPRR